MQPLISAVELAHRLGEPDLVVVDCRFDLMNPGAGRLAWQQGHIPGAFYADLDKDLAAPRQVATGRHPLPDPEKFGSLLGSWGLTPEKQLVAYDDVGNAVAARLWWLLRWVGHERVALLDGGLREWQRQELPLTADVPAPVAGRYPVAAGSMPVIETAAVEQSLEDPGLVIVDARDKRRFAGEAEPIDAKAGHIPGSLNRPFTENLQQGLFKGPAELRREFEALAAEAGGAEFVFSCGSGVTACHNLFAYELAGLNDSQCSPGLLYAGSWSEWIASDDRPIEVAADSATNQP
jgi:thiosulfate/3-mercaptopyruvate sulfurtransferase